MNLQGSVIIAAPRPRVWEALNTPEVLARCIEGVERLERIAGPDGERLEGRMNAKVGPVRATFTGFVTLQDVVEGQSYRLVGEGKGGVAGFARGEADVTLTDQDGGTLLAYEVRSSVGGKLAQLGARLIEGTAKAYAEGFFARLKAEVEVTDTAPEPAQEAAPDPNPAQTAAQTPDQTPEPATRGLSPSVWAGLLILAVLGILAWQWN